MSNLFSGLPSSVTDFFNNYIQQAITQAVEQKRMSDGILADANGTSGETLFEGNEETTAALSEKVDSLEKSASAGTTSADTAEVDPVKEAEKQAAIEAAKQKQEELTAKETERDEAYSDYTEKAKAYSDACTAVTNAKEALDTASDNYNAIAADLAEAKNALAEMNDNLFEKAGNWLTGLFSDSTDYKNMQQRVADLEAQEQEAFAAREKAQEEYDTAVKEKKTAFDEAKAAQQAYKDLDSDVADLQDELDDLIATAEALQAGDEASADAPTDVPAVGDTTGDVPVDNTDPMSGMETETPVEETQKITKNEIEQLINPTGEQLTDEELSVRQSQVIKDNFSDDDIINAALEAGISLTDASVESLDTLSTEDKAKIIENLTKGAGETVNLADELFNPDDTSILDDMAYGDESRKELDRIKDIRKDGFDKISEEVKEYFKGEGIELDLIDTKDMTPEQIIKHAAKILEVELVAQSYSKGGAMAKADTATVDEHRDAESGFTDAVLQISDVVNSSDVEFFNLSDQSNYELNMALLDRINSGEYIKTSTLEKQTSAVQNIQVTHTSHSKDNDDKYNQYSNAILDQLQQMISDEEGAEMNDHTFNSIKSQFDIKAAQSMEEAFEFLEDEARKYGIRQAIEQD